MQFTRDRPQPSLVWDQPVEFGVGVRTGRESQRIRPAFESLILIRTGRVAGECGLEALLSESCGASGDVSGP